ncbi:hypothetical protein X291_04330 [Oenococcus oeni IOEB_C23]|uniref:oligosaccharide repeat unit polymerase n=1 Tax=Oenococcus oeni TaxID=1247 RepID=UPI00050DDC59|nr:oligosaccharide repeat unit polymerase [Oenococcus oeni]KGH65881.1 hypothetical protein X291_04330 [Oenococcus oeni IOEB_C23]
MTKFFTHNAHLIESSKSINIFDYFTYFFYFLFIFFQVISNSSWHFFINLGDLASPLSRTNIFFLIVLFLISCLRDWNIKQFIVTMVLTFILLAYFLKYGSNLFSVFLVLVLVGMAINPVKLLKIDFYARLFSVLLIIFLSLIGILPKSGNAGSYTDFYYSVFLYGFTWSPILGYLILIIFLEFILLFKIKKSVLVATTILYVFFQLSIGYMTGIIGGAMAIILLFLSRHKFFNLPSLALLTYPFLFLVTVYVSIYYNSASSMWALWNDITSFRISIWQYYLQNWKINFFGNIIPDQNNIIGSTVLGHGALDGGYIFFLIKYGFLSIMIIYSLIVIVKYEYDNKIQKDISRNGFWIFVIISILTAFSETSSFLAYFSPFAALLGSLAFFNRDKLKIELEYRDKVID